MKIYIFSSILLFLLSCSKKEVKHTVENTIKFEFISEDTPFNDIFSNSKIIALETLKECLLAEISSIDIRSDTLLILDKKTKTVVIFDIKGNYLSKIGNRGKGPGEYIRPKQAFFSNNKKQIKIYDSALKKIICYSNSGELIEETFIDYYPRKIFELKDGYFGYCPNKFYNKSKEIKNNTLRFIKYNNQGKVLSFKYGETITDKLDIDSYLSIIHDNEIHFTEPYRNKIFKFEGDQISVIYNIDYGKFSLPNKEKTKLQNLTFDSPSCMKTFRDYSSKYAFLISNYLENDKWIILYTPFKGRTLIYEKPNLKKIGEFSGLCIDPNSWETFIYPLLIKNNTIYCYLNPQSFYHYLENSNMLKTMTENRINAIKSILQNHKKTDNPLILTYEIKKDL